MVPARLDDIIRRYALDFIQITKMDIDEVHCNTSLQNCKMSSTNAHHEIAQTRSALLRSRTQAFCDAFLDLPNNPPDKLLAKHFTSTNPRITEHGPTWANDKLPFLGKTFAGRDGCLEYFTLLSEVLAFIPNEDTFPSKEGFIVDDQASAEPTHGGSGKGWDGRGAVSVVGNATFKAIKTGKDWDEQFIYRLSDFDEDGKIGHWVRHRQRQLSVGA